MSSYPLVSVITPTWNRRSLLLDQCIPSVQAQDYPNIEHIIVTDGPGIPPALMAMLRVRLNENRRKFHHPVHIAEMSSHHGFWGNAAKRWAIQFAAKGDLIAYLDDDDIYLPDHVSSLQEHISDYPSWRTDQPNPLFAYSAARASWPSGPYLIGEDPPALMGITNSAIMHHRSLIEIANWRDHAPAHYESGLYREEDWHIKAACPDWDLVKRWKAANVNWKFTDTVTVVTRPHSFSGVKDSWHEIEAVVSK